MSALATRVGELESGNILNPITRTICCRFVRPPPQGPYTPESAAAQLNGITLHRQPDETADEFEERAKAAATPTAPGCFSLVVFSGPAPAEPGARP